MNNCRFWNIPVSIAVKQSRQQLDKKSRKRLKFQDNIQTHSVIMLFTLKPVALLLLRVLTAFPLFVLILGNLLVRDSLQAECESWETKIWPKAENIAYSL